MSGLGGFGGGGGGAPVSYGRELNVGPGLVGVRDAFPTLKDCLDYIDALPALQKPADDYRYKIKTVPGWLMESGWIPNFCHVEGPGPWLGGLYGADADNNWMLSLGIGSVSNLGMHDGFVRTTQPNSCLWLRANEHLYIHQKNITFPFAGGTLILAGTGITPDETVTLPPTANWAAFVADITARGVAVFFYDGLHGNANEGVVGIINITSTGGSRTVTIRSTGTANAALGFSTTSDTVTDSSVMDIRRTENMAISGIPGGIGFKPGGSGVLVTDYSTAAKIGSLFCGGVPIGVNFVDWVWGSPSPPYGNECYIFDSVIIFCPVGVYVGRDRKANLFTSLLVNTVDIDSHPLSTINAISTAYRDRTINAGQLIPAGGRVTYTWKLTGNIIAPILALDGIRALPYDMSIESVVMWRGTPGGTGKTEIDLLRSIGGGAFATVYTTTANRPKIYSTDLANKVVVGADPDVYKLSAGDQLRLDVLTAETGPASANLSVSVTAVINPV